MSVPEQPNTSYKAETEYVGKKVDHPHYGEGVVLDSSDVDTVMQPGFGAVRVEFGNRVVQVGVRQLTLAE